MNDEIHQKIDTFFRQYKRRVYRKGEILIRADENPPGVFYIVIGSVRQYTITENGSVIILNIFKPPAFFPMSWAINMQENEYYFEAMETVETYMAPPEAAVKFLRDNPDVTFNLMSRLYRGTDGLLKKMSYLMGASAYSRVILELVISARRFGQVTPSGQLRLVMTASDLAARTGMSRETVSRELQKLKSEDLIRISLGIVIINEVKQLEAKLISNPA